MKIFILIGVFILVTFLPCMSFAQSGAHEKKLIEFGWDYPKVSFLKDNIDKMQKTPFDGVVFSFDFDIYNAFDTKSFEDRVFQYKDLSEISWQNFTDNFLFVRGAGHSGAHWLDDSSWNIITKNLEKVSKALAISKAKGIGFDPEYNYQDSTLNPWIYRASRYNNLSYRQVGEYVRRRGKQFIEALQTNKPDIKILCFWLLGLVYDQSLHVPIEKTGMALYPFFVEGMLEGQNSTSEIIDGNESSYWYQKPEHFIASGENLKIIGTRLLDKSLQSRYDNISHAQAVFFDGLYAKNSRFEKGFDTATKARWLRHNLYNAFKTSDKYVWFYSERINWWKAEVDAGVNEIINAVKTEIRADQNNQSDERRGGSVVMDFKKKQHTDYSGFKYLYTKSKNLLEITVLNKMIAQIQVYDKSRLIYEDNSIAGNITINLDKIYSKNGNLIVIAKDNKGVVSVAYVN